LDPAALSGPLLTGEVALITGGGSGLGLAIAKRFIAEGAQVALFDRSSERLAEAVQLLGDAVEAIEGDVRSISDNEWAVRRSVERFGKLTVFVGNAGIYDQRASISDLPPEKLDAAFDELFATNVKGYALGAKAAAQELARHRGSIIFTTSVSGLHAGFGGFLYVAAKHAITGLTRQLAIELAPDVRVNAIAPGYVPTRLAGISVLAQAESKSGGRAAGDFLLKSVPEADDYTLFYAVAASREAGAILTGSIILADGGASLRTQ
jgi:NAD(P)-dependent dehydrogenase (short-subunit alcohol dehydrogenase family)